MGFCGVFGRGHQEIPQYWKAAVLAVRRREENGREKGGFGAGGKAGQGRARISMCCTGGSVDLI